MGEGSRPGGSPFNGWLASAADLERRFHEGGIEGRDGEERIELIRSYTLAAMMELSEFLQETDWKPWKEGTQVQAFAALEELVDVLHFVANLLLLIGADDERLNMVYSYKVNENERRLDAGENKRLR